MSVATQTLETEQVPSAGEEAMNNLTRMWYSAMVTGLNLSADTFQIYQSNVELGDRSSLLWAAYNSTPPASISQLATPGTISSFAGNYDAVISNLIPSGGAEFEKTMGDKMAAWDTYNIKAHGEGPVPDEVLLFTNWANGNMANPATRQKAITQFKQMQNGVVPVAVNRFLDAKGKYAYNRSIAELLAAVKKAPAQGYSFNSKNAKNTTDLSWAKGKISASSDFLWGEGGVNLDHINKVFGTSDISIEVKLKHVLAFAAGPLQTEDLVGGELCPGWFSSAALNFAFQNKGSNVWPAEGVSWESTFGDKGNIKRFATSLIVGDELEMTMWSNATFTGDERQTIEAHGKGGFWPFYRASASGSNGTKVEFEGTGKMKVTVTSPPDSPLILGVSVLPIERIFS
ncbi:MAG TPA: hypothetical protein VGG20_12095 [Thermoanaerobaculia bacterium]|jgi:hypothetical protein